MLSLGRSSSTLVSLTIYTSLCIYDPGLRILKSTAIASTTTYWHRDLVSPPSKRSRPGPTAFHSTATFAALSPVLPSLSTSTTLYDSCVSRRGPRPDPVRSEENATTLGVRQCACVYADGLLECNSLIQHSRHQQQSFKASDQQLAEPLARPVVIGGKNEGPAPASTFWGTPS